MKHEMFRGEWSQWYYTPAQPCRTASPVAARIAEPALFACAGKIRNVFLRNPTHPCDVGELRLRRFTAYYRANRGVVPLQL